MNEPRPRWIVWPEELRRRGILGINQRNVDYIGAYNPRLLYPRVDNKLVTKQICQANGIPVPDTYFVLDKQSDVTRFMQTLGDRTDFVCKPASGAGGRGIIVISSREGNSFFTPGGREITSGDLRYHLSTTLSGLYSLGGQTDEVIVEQRIVNHPALSDIVVGGTPDVRVIAYRGVPVMAMTRLPTEMSGGKANLHQGAVAAAVDLMHGRTFGGVCQDRTVQKHPDTGVPIKGIEIPEWRRLLTAAMRLADALEMGYVGIDFVIDVAAGPVVLEANARPGLAIQLAHREGLVPRLKFVEQRVAENLPHEERWKIVEKLCDRFGQIVLHPPGAAAES
ncbi:MAG: alpha-L-glutamate ligase-like protein [Planctomycetaceae bacterium]|nr:alpha-L-glutamate ligase-like protein [Planctomycetaceae bacterium]